LPGLLKHVLKVIILAKTILNFVVKSRITRQPTFAVGPNRRNQVNPIMASTTDSPLTKITLLAVGLALLGAFVFLAPSPVVCSWDFRGSLWGPSYMLLHGLTPYSWNTPYGPYPGIWMPQTIGAFFVIGFLPCWLAAKFWFLSEIFGLLLIIWLASGKKMPSQTLFAISLLLIFFFVPLYIHLGIGQISIFITVMVMLVVFLPKEGYPPDHLAWWMPLLLALGLAKPQLGILVYPGLLAGMLRYKGLRGGIRLVLSIAAWIIVLIVPLFLLDSGWVKGFLNITLGNTSVTWDLPVPMVQLRAALGAPGVLLWALIFLACLSFTLWLWLKRDARLALVWSLALTPIATIYCSSWDFMLMIPLLIWTLLRLQTIPARIVLVGGALLVDILQVAQRWKTSLPDGRNWWIPPFLLAVIALAIGIEHLIHRTNNQMKF
jgi:hypothetical protein